MSRKLLLGFVLVLSTTAWASEPEALNMHRTDAVIRLGNTW